MFETMIRKTKTEIDTPTLLLYMGEVAEEH